MHRAAIAEQLNHAQYHGTREYYLRLIEEVREDLDERVETVEWAKLAKLAREERERENET